MAEKPTLTIQIPEGFEVDVFDQATGKITFRPLKKPVTKLINSIEDACAELFTSIRWDADVDNYRQAKKQFGERHHITAYCALVVITKALNEGWQPDWSNKKEYKYYPWFEMGGSSGFRFGADWITHSAVGSRLCFKSKELAVYAGKTFADLYKTYLTYAS